MEILLLIRYLSRPPLFRCIFMELRLQMNVRCMEMEAEVAKLEGYFRELLLRGAEALNANESCAGCCIHLGQIVLLLVDTSWGWLGKDGRVERISTRFAAIHPKVRDNAHIS